MSTLALQPLSHLPRPAISGAFAQRTAAIRLMFELPSICKLPTQFGEARMRIRTVCLLAATAIALGVASPYLDHLCLDDQHHRIPFLYDWFHWLPGIISYWLEAESDTAFMALWVAICVLQYLMLFVALWALARFVTLLHHFIRPHRHRAGLIRSAP
jgi:hypothetical protein